MRGRGDFSCANLSKQSVLDVLTAAAAPGPMGPTADVEEIRRAAAFLAVEMLGRLDPGRRPSTPELATAARLYVCRGMSADAIARACHCSRASVWAKILVASSRLGVSLTQMRENRNSFDWGYYVGTPTDDRRAQWLEEFDPSHR